MRNHYTVPVGFAHTVDDAIQFMDNMDGDTTYGTAVCSDGTLSRVFVMEAEDGIEIDGIEDQPAYVLRELATCKPPYDFRAIFLDDKWIASNIQ